MTEVIPQTEAGRLWLAEYQARQQKQANAGHRPATRPILTPTPSLVSNGIEGKVAIGTKSILVDSTQPNPIVGPKTGISWDELDRQAREAESRPQLAFVRIGEPNPDYSENYICPKDEIPY